MASTSGPTQSGAIFTGTVEQLLETRGHGLQAHFGVRFAFGTSEVRREDHAGAVFQGILNGGQRRLDALVAGDFHDALLVLLQRHVEIHADENTLAFQVEIANR